MQPFTLKLSQNIYKRFPSGKVTDVFNCASVRCKNGIVIDDNGQLFTIVDDRRQNIVGNGRLTAYQNNYTIRIEYENGVVIKATTNWNTL